MRQQRCLVLHFNIYFTEANARQAIADLGPLLAGEGSRVTMVWECTHMTGYDQAARDLWQEFIKGLLPKVAAIHLVSQNLLIRVGGSVVGIFAGAKVSTWASFQEFEAG